MVELLLKHGARVDVEARMCWPGPHQQNCEERSKQSRQLTASRNRDAERESSKYDKLQCAIYYAIDGDQVRTMHWLSRETHLCISSSRSGGHPGVARSARGGSLASLAAEAAAVAHCL